MLVRLMMVLLMRCCCGKQEYKYHCKIYIISFIYECLLSHDRIRLPSGNWEAKSVRNQEAAKSVGDISYESSFLDNLG